MRPIEQYSPLAVAMAVRDMKEFEMEEQRRRAQFPLGGMPGMMGMPSVEMSSALKQTLFMGNVASKDAIIKRNFVGYSPVERMESLRQTSEDIQLYQAFLDQVTPVLPDDLKDGYTLDSIKALGDSMSKSFVGQFESFAPSDFSHMKKEIEEAKKIGEQKNVDIEAVYLDDKLYAELFRRTNTPLELAQRTITSVGAMDLEMLLKNIMGDVLKDGVFPGMDKLDQPPTEDELSDILTNSFMGDALRGMNDMAKQASIDSMLHKINRFWGPEGIRSLPVEVKRFLKIPEEPQNTSKELP